MTPETQAIVTAVIIGAIAIVKDWQGHRQVEKIVEHDEKLVALVLTDHQVAIAKLEDIQQRQDLIERMVKGDLKS